MSLVAELAPVPTQTDRPFPNLLSFAEPFNRPTPLRLAIALYPSEPRMATAEWDIEQSHRLLTIWNAT